MRVLAISDIHGNIEAVERMRLRQANSFDVVIVAGDISGIFTDYIKKIANLHSIFDILRTFGCPVLYIYGNHDHVLKYDMDFGDRTHHLHNSPFPLGEFVFSGFSGCSAHWGNNPHYVRCAQPIDDAWEKLASEYNIAAAKGEKALAKLRMTEKYQHHDFLVSALQQRVLNGNRHELAAGLIPYVSQGKIPVIVTHAKPEGFRNFTPHGTPFIYGHVHKPSDTIMKTTGFRLLNVAAVDRPVTVHPINQKRFRFRDLRQANAGNYVTFVAGAAGLTEVQCWWQRWDISQWAPIEPNDVYHGMVRLQDDGVADADTPAIFGATGSQMR